MMSESSKRHSKFLSLIFILKCLSKASVINQICTLKQGQCLCLLNKQIVYQHACDMISVHTVLPNFLKTNEKDSNVVNYASYYTLSAMFVPPSLKFGVCSSKRV